VRVSEEDSSSSANSQVRKGACPLPNLQISAWSFSLYQHRMLCCAGGRSSVGGIRKVGGIKIVFAIATLSIKQGEH
jgi:hypothetical protein